MRHTGAIVAILALGAALSAWLVAERGGPRDEPVEAAAAPREGGGDASGDGRLERLERRVEELGGEVARLSRELARSRDGGRTEAEEATAREVAHDLPPAAERTPHWYLGQYVASFRGGGRGSEYFRLAVEAYAPELLTEIAALVLEPSTNALLRERLTAMLGDGRFHGNGHVIGTLLSLVTRDGGAAALSALEAVGDAGAARGLERVLWGILPELRERALGVLVALARPEANAALGRLYATAPGDAERALLLSRLDPVDPLGALELFVLASTDVLPLRLAAASEIPRFRHDETVAFVRRWLGYETDRDVRALLGAAEGTLTTAPPYSAEKLVGPPDSQGRGDHVNAWCPAQADMGDVWLELAFPARRVHTVRVHQMFTFGAVAEIRALDAGGTSHKLWIGVGGKDAQVFEASFATTDFAVVGLRIRLDTNRAPGWNEVDAVQIDGPEGSAWASAARASSTYGS